MITKKEFEAAMVIVNDYCDQIAKKKYVAENANEVGCRVKLSAWGRKMQRPHNKEGMVEKFRIGIARALIGERDSLTIIGPAAIVKEIKKDPRKIEVMLNK